MISSSKLRDIRKMILLTVFVLISILGVSSFFVFFLRIKRNNDNIDSRMTKSYKYTRYNPLTKEISVGIYESFRNIEDDNNFFSYEGTDDSILISSFDSTAYQCTGNCFCDDFSTVRRRGGGILSTMPVIRGLQYMVATLSAFAAIKYAKRHFNDECENSILSSSKEYDCPIDSIRSEVEECRPLVNAQQSEILRFPDGRVLNDDDEDGLMDEQGGKRKSYFCRGNCMTKRVNLPNLNAVYVSIVEEFAKSYGCEYLKLENEFNIVIPPGGNMKLGKTEMEHVNTQFGLRNLEPFCQKNSLVSTANIIEAAILDVGDEMSNMWACEALDEKNSNPSIDCVELHQTPYNIIH